jgi:hypothetical protein
MWPWFARKIVHQGTDERRQSRGIGLRRDLMAAAGPGRDGRAKALDHDEHEYSGP